MAVSMVPSITVGRAPPISDQDTAGWHDDYKNISAGPLGSVTLVFAKAVSGAEKFRCPAVGKLAQFWSGFRHTPPWDLKQEREHEAANPGPSISRALMQERTEAWEDPSDKKATRPEAGSQADDPKRRKICSLPDIFDDEDLVPPLTWGGRIV